MPLFKFLTGGLALTMVLAATAKEASALTASIPYAGYTVIGMNNGYPWAFTMKDWATCERTGAIPLFNLNANPPPPAGGLSEDVVLNGTSSGETIVVVGSGTVVHCGFPFTALLPGDFSMTINGNAGGDWIEANGVVSIAVNGGDGNDLLANRGGGFWGALTPTTGGAGDDTIYGDADDWLYGNGGNDHFCIHPGTVPARISGSTGTDTRCNGAGANITSVESTNCNFCAL